MSVSLQLSIDDSLVDDDSDFDDLPPLSADIPDAEECQDGVYPPFPFTKIYEEPMSFADPNNDWLIPNCPVICKIIDVQRDSTSHLLNPNLYTIEVEHSSFKWHIKRRYKHFKDLHQELVMFRASLNIPLPTRKHKDRRKSIKKVQRRAPPRFPRKPEALVSMDQLANRANQLQDYLQSLLSIPMYRNHPAMMRFLEVSPLSFISDLGRSKGKEMLVKKRAGGFRRATCCTRLENLITDLTGHWRRRWLIVKDSSVVYMRPKDGRVRSVMLMDQGWSVQSGTTSIGVHHGVRISNWSRDLMVKCWTARKARELADHLMAVSRTTASEYTASNRYDSFAPVRLPATTRAQWLVDGAAHFEAVAEAIEQAKEEVFITDWWLSPEIYTQRPVIYGDKWRLDSVIKRKAEAGVKFYILLYKEVELALGINSMHTKRILTRLHPNVKVFRHPDRTSGPMLWSHHEKLVIVDQTVAFVGGIDLCYGRWDTHHHRVTDLGGISVSGSTASLAIRNSTTPSGLRSSQRSVNKFFANVDDMVRRRSFDEIINIKNKSDSFSGDRPEVHYLERIISVNEPQTPDVGLDEVDTAIKKVSEKSNGKPAKNEESPKEESKVQETKFTKKEEASKEEEPKTEENPKKSFTSRLKNKRMYQAVIRMQILRRQTRRKHADSNVDDLSDDDEPESGGQHLPAGRSASESALTQMGITETATTKLWFGKDYANFIVKDFTHVHRPFTEDIDRNTIPRMPWHDVSCCLIGSGARDLARHFVQRWNFVKQSKAKYDKKYPWILHKSNSVDVDKYMPSFMRRRWPVTCQVVRSATGWSVGTKITERSILNAYVDIISNAKHYIYIENQFFITSSETNQQPQELINGIGEAIYHRVVRAFMDRQPFRVYVLLPLLPAFEGELGTASGTSIQAITHYNYSSISRGRHSLIERLRSVMGDSVIDYVGFFSLRNYGQLHGKLTTELVYVHSKILIADDRIAVIGSSNINDRSMLGARDSEVAVVIADDEFVPSTMNGKPFSAGKFCCSLRRRLMKEHLGIVDANPNKWSVRDPVIEAFFKNIWLATALKNTDIYESVFPVVPTDKVRSFLQLKNYFQEPRLADEDEEEARRQLEMVKGHLVMIPLQFLADDDLRPSVVSKEALMPNTIWT